MNQVDRQGNQKLGLENPVKHNSNLDHIKSSKEVSVPGGSVKKRKKQNSTTTGSESQEGQDQQTTAAGVQVSVLNSQTGFQKSGVENVADLDNADSSVPGEPVGKSKRKKKKKKNKMKIDTNPPVSGSELHESKGLQTTITGVIEVSVFNKQAGFQKSESTIANISTTAAPDKSTSAETKKLEQTTAFLDLDDDDDPSKDNGLQLSGMGMSQEQLIRQAFAGDDVEADFQDIKSRAMDQEVAKIEEPTALPGWGQWTHVQKKREQPGWREELEKKRREEAIKKRKDANLKFVVISEKLDKKVPGHLVLILHAMRQ